MKKQKLKTKPAEGQDEIASDDDLTAAAAPEILVEKEKLGSGKGVETLFRTASQVDLDIISLAATKANIMISLNGIIISALMISGAFIFASSAAFLIPAGIFLTTSALSIIFAMLSASPERSGLPAYNLSLKRLWSRQAATPGPTGLTIADQSDPHRGGDRLNLLLYSDRAKLDRDEYWQQIKSVLHDREEIYRQMSDQLYWLGHMADQKFKMLNISYLVFRWGMVVAVAAFLCVKIFMFAAPSLGYAAESELGAVGIGSLKTTFEPSAVQHIGDGQVLVVEDEPTRAFTLMSVSADGRLVEDPASTFRLTRSFGEKISDLEGLTSDDKGNLYAITSHALTKKGKRQADRERFARFRFRGGEAVDIAYAPNLRDAILQSSDLSQALETVSGKKLHMEALNIEGLAYDPRNGDILLGVRDPLAAGKSIVIPITNPQPMFDQGTLPAFGTPVLLDLDEGGIRSMNYNDDLKTFLIVNEVEGYDGDKHSQLWSWSGNAKDPPRSIPLPSILNLKNVEALDSVVVGGKKKLLMMSDEGDEKKNRPGKYMVIDYDELR